MNIYLQTRCRYSRKRANICQTHGKIWPVFLQRSVSVQPKTGLRTVDQAQHSPTPTAADRRTCSRTSRSPGPAALRWHGHFINSKWWIDSLSMKLLMNLLLFFRQNFRRCQFKFVELLENFRNYEQELINLCNPFVECYGEIGKVFGEIWRILEHARFF